MEELTYYKVIDVDSGYSKFICTTGYATSVLYFGGKPKADAFAGPYKKHPDEVLQPSCREEYYEKFDEYIGSGSYKELINQSIKS